MVSGIAGKEQINRSMWGIVLRDSRKLKDMACSFQLLSRSVILFKSYHI